MMGEIIEFKIGDTYSYYARHVNVVIKGIIRDQNFLNIMSVSNLDFFQNTRRVLTEKIWHNSK